MKVNDVLDELESFEVEGGSKLMKLQVSSNLPSMPKNSSRSKFSSWNTADDQKKVVPSNFMDEVDELLLEQELLSPVSAS
jgi:hypothetical protein